VSKGETNIAITNLEDIRLDYKSTGVIMPCADNRTAYIHKMDIGYIHVGIYVVYTSSVVTERINLTDAFWV